jgi:hypothetical protein
MRFIRHARISICLFRKTVKNANIVEQVGEVVADAHA